MRNEGSSSKLSFSVRGHALPTKGRGVGGGDTTTSPLQSSKNHTKGLPSADKYFLSQICLTAVDFSDTLLNRFLDRAVTRLVKRDRWYKWVTGE